MEIQEITAKVKEIIKKELKVADDSQITDKARFVEDLKADSLDMSGFWGTVEEDLGVSISEEEVSKLATVGEAIQYLAKKLS